MPSRIKPGQQVLAAALPLPLTGLDLLKQVVERLYGTGDTLLDFSGETLRVIAPEGGFGPRIIDDEDHFDLPAPDPGETRVRYAKLRDGRLTMSLEEAEDAIADFLLAQTTYFNGNEAINYVETSLAAPGEEPQYIVIMQKAGQPTPHELRIAADERADRLEAAVREAVEQLGRGEVKLAEQGLRALAPDGLNG